MNLIRKSNRCKVVMICILMTFIINCSEKALIKPEVVTIKEPAIIPINPALLEDCKIIDIPPNKIKYLEIYQLLLKSIIYSVQCSKRIKTIRDLQPNDKSNK